MICFDMPEAPARVDVIKPRQHIRVDTTFWQHRSIFAGSQEQLDQLRREADARARARYAEHLRVRHETARRRTFELHRPAIRRLTPILHVGFIPLLWAITTCKCGDRWPCNSVKQYFRSRVGWSVDITDHLNDATRRLPKPATRLSRLRRALARPFRRPRPPET